MQWRAPGHCIDHVHRSTRVKQHRNDFFVPVLRRYVQRGLTISPRIIENLRAAARLLDKQVEREREARGKCKGNNNARCDVRSTLSAAALVAAQGKHEVD